ncbi:MAG: hypothetical protein KDA96_05925, partial [Planctomycetaceae bacterium]|nr:hypothetical protein [Planctomycetaceae bacterium]
MNALRLLAEKLVHGSPLNGDDVIALLLLLAMIASLSHLLTMLVTRWGDRNIAFKSLLASVLIHSVCLLGLEVFDPQLVREVKAAVETSPEPVYDVEVLVESDQNLLLSHSGNTALVDRPVQPEVELMRSEVASPDELPQELPERPDEELPPTLVAEESVSQFEEQAVPEMAAARYSGEIGETQAAVEDPAADLKIVTETTPEQIAAPERLADAVRQMTTTDVVEETPVSMPDQGTRQFSPDVVPEDLSIETPATSISSIDLPPVVMEDVSVIDRRESPVVSPEIGDLIGLSADPVGQAAASSSVRTQIPRLSQARPNDSPAPEMVRPGTTRAQTPIPLASNAEDVRIGTALPQPTDAVRTGAPVRMDVSVPRIRRSQTPVQVYQLRNAQKRREVVTRFGGTQESEDAVERSLKWLASVQAPDGHWDAEEFGAGQVEEDEFGTPRDFAGRDADTGLTALVVLAFLGAGHTHDAGNYTVEVDRALDWLIQQQADDGNLFGNARYYARMYCHGMATYALAEAYGMEKDAPYGAIVSPDLLTSSMATTSVLAGLSCSMSSGQPILAVPFDLEVHEFNGFHLAHRLRTVDEYRLRAALDRAVTFTVGRQDVKSGGWRYIPMQPGDVSMFGWQMMSLKSAEIAGVHIDDRVWQRMNSFLESVRQGTDGGLFGYRQPFRDRNGKLIPDPVTPVMTAEALFCQQMLGYPRDTASSRESVRYLVLHPPRMAELNYYYWY